MYYAVHKTLQIKNMLIQKSYGEKSMEYTDLVLIKETNEIKFIFYLRILEHDVHNNSIAWTNIMLVYRIAKLF